jgi:hypothetical protein
MGTPCPFCGTQHDTTACPPPPDLSPITLYEESGMATINGLTFGEHEICRRLDKIIEVIEKK